jgi:hypothetical protein
LKPSNLETFDRSLYTDSFPLTNISLAPGKRTRGGFMHRCSPRLLLTLAATMTLVVILTGCLGKGNNNSGNEGVQSVSLSPTGTLSIDVGGTEFFSATGRNAAGGTVLGLNIQYVVVSGSPNISAPLSVTANGAACAGTWDSTGTQCNAGTPGIALVTAVIEGVSSPQAIVYVHQHIDSIKIIQAESQPPPHNCFSQGDIWLFQGVAYSNGADITSSVGPMNWSSSNSGVVLPNSNLPLLQPNQVQMTARNPGITQLFANVAGTTSSPYPYTTCLVSYVRLQIQGSQANSVTLNNGGSVALSATAVDTLGVVVANPPLTWSTSNPEIVSFGAATNNTGTNSAVSRSNLGGAAVTVSCTPPTCNTGVFPSLPVYASNGKLLNGQTGYNAISVDVTSTAKPPTYTAWAATTGCADQPGCSSALFSITPNTAGTNPIATIISVPRTPNSMMFNFQSSARVYLGSDQGLMYSDVGAASPSVVLVSNASTPCNVALCGKILTISNDGKLVVISDTVSTPSQVYIFNSGATGAAPIDLIIPGATATAAAFSPDQLKLFILTDAGTMYVYSTVDALTSVPIATTATDVKFSVDGSFAYVAGTPSPGNIISGRATCNADQTVHDPTIPAPLQFDFVTTPLPGPPLQLFPSPDGQHVFALDPPNVDTFETVDAQVPVGSFLCNAPTVNFPSTAQFSDLGQGPKVPIFARLVGNGSQIVVVDKNVPAVLFFDVTTGFTSSVTLARAGFGQTYPLSASASTDGSQIYVAACDQYPNNDPLQPCAAGSVHIVAVGNVNIGQGDFLQVPYINTNDNNDTNMCNGQGGSAPLCLPNLVAIKPQ